MSDTYEQPLLERRNNVVTTDNDSKQWRPAVLVSMFIFIVMLSFYIYVWSTDSTVTGNYITDALVILGATALPMYVEYKWNKLMK
jgi:hypothetical protein